MDNLTHTLFGVALAKTRLGRVSPWAPAAILVAANLPDADIIVQAFGGKPAYLVYHRGITHALLGIAGQAVGLTLVFAVLERLFRRQKAPEPPPSSDEPELDPKSTIQNPKSIWGLLLAVTIGLLSHPLLDGLNTYGIRPWLPFDDTWYYGDLVFIVDPWLWLIFGGAACLAGRRTRVGSVVLALIAVLATILILRSERAPLALRIIWPAALICFAAARMEGIGRRRPHRVTGVGLAITALYLGGLGITRGVATRQGEPVLATAVEPGETIQARTRSPQPANPFTWTMTAETEAAIYQHQVDVLDGPGDVSRTPNGLDHQVVNKVLNTPEGRAWRIFARHPIFRIDQDERGTRALLMDARYPPFPAPNWCTLSVPVDEERVVEREPK